jgi:3-oxoacyl-[acyl-carrier protein] reductase
MLVEMRQKMNYDKIFLILGASSDIGCELINQLNQDCRNTLFLAHYNSSDMNINKIQVFEGNEIVIIKANLANDSDVNMLIKKVEEEYGVPSHIVHLPAVKFEYSRLKEMEWNKFCTDLKVQVYSLVQILQAFMPVMAKRNAYNKVVVMLSSYTLSAPPKFTMSYTMIKYTLLGFIKSAASDYSDKKININGISPSMIETKFLDNVDSRIVEMNAQKSAGKVNAVVQDIVPAITFLLSDKSNFINGINLNVTNGNVL